MHLLVSLNWPESVLTRQEMSTKKPKTHQVLLSADLSTLSQSSGHWKGHEMVQVHCACNHSRYDYYGSIWLKNPCHVQPARWTKLNYTDQCITHMQPPPPKKKPPKPQPNENWYNIYPSMCMYISCVGLCVHVFMNLMLGWFVCVFSQTF